MKISRPRLPVILVMLGLLSSGASGALRATEFGATHVVFEKGTKMKKVETSLFMSALDQSEKSDDLARRRSVRCRVAATGSRGDLAVRGAVNLRLQGAAGASAPWRSLALSETLDQRGDVFFEADAILGLVDEAATSGAEPELFRIEFDGGKGGKVTQVTLDCIHEAEE